MSENTDLVDGALSEAKKGLETAVAETEKAISELRKIKAGMEPAFRFLESPAGRGAISASVVFSVALIGYVFARMSMRNV